MRVKKRHTDIDYNKTRDFFQHRADKFQKNNPYSVTMYQDNNAELVRERNEHEIKKLIPYLEIDTAAKVLDIACGIGRWADALSGDIAEYCGIDFSPELIQIANERNRKENFNFYVGSALQLNTIMSENKKECFNKVLLIGILMYLNDNDVDSLLQQVEQCCAEHATICIREPIGIEDRLTLKDFYSEELADNYNAIYRTRNELNQFFAKSLSSKGFSIKREGLLFSEKELNNRSETTQYYYIIER